MTRLDARTCQTVITPETFLTASENTCTSSLRPAVRAARLATGQAIENIQLNCLLHVSQDGNPVAMSSMLIMSIIPIDIVA